MSRGNSRIRRCVVLFLFVWCATAGCGDGKPWVDKSMNEATVSGVVSVKGKPADGGTILFNGNSSGRSVPIRTAEIGPDGSYTIKAFTGVNQVSFDGKIASKNRGVGLVKEACDVASGENEANFDLMGEGSGKKPLLPVEDKGAGKRSQKGAKGSYGRAKQ
jgi:hypothetical protein